MQMELSGSPKRNAILVLMTFLLTCAQPAHCQTKKDAASLRDQGISLYNNKDYPGSIALLEKHLASYPNDYFALYFAALSYQQTGQLTRAIYNYQRVSQLAGNSQYGQYAQQILAKISPQSTTNASGKASSSNKSSSSSSSTSSSTAPSSDSRQSSSSAGKSASGKSGSSSNSTSTSTSQVVALDPNLPKECDVNCMKDNHGRIWVDAYLENRPVKLLFDTGAPTVFIGQNQLNQYGINLNLGTANCLAGGSSSDERIPAWMKKLKVKVGPIERTTSVQITEVNHADPLLGQSFFKEFDYTIDGGGGRIHFRQKALGQGGAVRNSYSVPFAWREHGHRVIVNVEINGKTGPVMFDTGNTASALCFHSEKQAKAFGIAIPDDAPTTMTSGVTGSGVSKVVTVSRIRMGPIDRSNIEVNVRNGADAQELPLLGQPFWENYQYTIDMNAKQIHFVRR
jgi:predicted aspartyl protease